MMNERGFSLLQVLVVAAIILILAAIAVPRIWPAEQFASEDSAATTMRNALADAVSLAEAGETRRFSATSVVGLPAGVLVNPEAYQAPNASTLATEFTLQGGRGTPLLATEENGGLRPATVAVVVADASDAWATAFVVAPSGIVTRYEWRDKQWQKY
jgi:type II secretory pathway pseudopilin PulG